MRTLARAVKSSMTSGVPLPGVYANLEKAGIRFKIGAVSMVAGEPGSFKSTLALNLLSRLAAKQIKGLYISAEDDARTVAKRMAAIMTGDWIEDVVQTIDKGDYNEHLKAISEHVSFEFRALKVQQIDDRIRAFRMQHGKFPDTVWIDNLMSMVDDPTDYHSQMMFIRDMAQIAATLPTCVIVLHHTKEHPENLKVKKTGPKPPPRWEIHGKVSQFPKTILTVDTVGGGETPDLHMGIAPVKNNDGPQDKTGRTYEDFWVTPQNARIVEM